MLSLLQSTMEALRRELKQYPSSFSVADDIRAVSSGEKIKLKDKLLLELYSTLNEFSTTMEKVRALNLLSFLYFDLGDRQNVNKYNCEVLQESPNNIIALTNNAWFSFKDRKNINVCEATLKHLKTLKLDKLAYVVAKAEMAFTYSRFGMKQYHNAVSLFGGVREDMNHILKERTQESKQNSPRGENVKKCDSVMELKCVWTYGYAMTLRRLLHVSNTNDEEDIDVIKKRHCSVFQLYGEIHELEDKSECIQRYKARALVEAGLLAYGVERNKFLFPRGMEGLLPRNSSIFMPTYMYFDTALEIFSDDVFVLERSGRYFRYVDDIERSIMLLTRAIDIKGTSFGYHHLALSYIRKLEYNPTKLRDMVESTNQTNIQNMLSFHQQTPESSSTGHSINEKRDIRSQDILSLTTGLATKCNVSDNSRLQTLPFENDLAQGSTNSPNSNISRDTIYTRTPIQCNEQSAHTLQRKHANTNTDLQCELDPMAKTFFPKGQCKLKEKFLSQQQSTQTHMINERSKQNHQTGFNTGNVYAYNSPHRFMPVETPHASKQNKNAKHFFENDSLGQLPLDYTVGRNDYTGIDGRFHRHDVNQYNRFHKMSMNGQNVRQRNMSHTKQHSAKPKLGNAVKCLRSPKHIDYEKHKDVIDTAISHLDKSTRISSNTAALYDKAVLYRQIKQNDKALEVLESLMQNEDDLCSSVTLANAYEQAAFCISDIIDNQEIVDEERAQQLLDDRQFYLKSSIEIECNIVAKHPYLGHCWRSAQTLRHILLSKSKTKRTKQTLKDLWFLYNKLHNHLEVIGVLKELKDLAEDDAERKEIIEEIVRKYLCVQNYEEAVIALCMFNRLNDRFSRVDQSLYFEVYIEAGLDAFRRKHFEKARLRIKKAFESFAEQQEDVSNNVSSLTDESEERYELFILSNLDDEGPGRNLMMMLNSLGLRTTFNADSTSILPGTPEVEGITKVMNLSKAFVILVNFDIEDKKMLHLVDRMQNIVENRVETSFIMVITNAETEFPSTCRLSAYKRLILDLDDISETDMGNEDTYEGVKSLLMAFAYIFDIE